MAAPKRLAEIAADGAMPIHQAVSAYFAAEIAAGRLKADQKLPAEREVGERFGISRMTARQAFMRMEADGIVYRRARSGWYVAPPRLHYHLGRSFSFVDNVRTQGGDPATRVLAALCMTPPDEVRAALELKTGDLVYHLLRLRLVGARAAMLERAFVPAAWCPGLDRRPLEGSLAEIWTADYGIRPGRLMASIAIRPLEGEEASALDAGEGAMALVIRNIYLDDEGRPFAFETQHWRAEAAEVDLDLKLG